MERKQSRKAGGSAFDGQHPSRETRGQTRHIAPQLHPAVTGGRGGREDPPGRNGGKHRRKKRRRIVSGRRRETRPQRTARGYVTQDALAFEESRGGDGEEQVRCEPRRRRKRQRLKRSKRTVMRLRAQKKKKQEGV